MNEFWIGRAKRGSTQPRQARTALTEVKGLPGGGEADSEATLRFHCEGRLGIAA